MGNDISKNKQFISDTFMLNSQFYLLYPKNIIKIKDKISEIDYIDSEYFYKLMNMKKSHKYAEKIFTILDYNNNEKINIELFLMTLILLSYSTFKEKIKYIFKIFDANKSNMLNKEELTYLIKIFYNCINCLLNLKKKLNYNYEECEQQVSCIFFNKKNKIENLSFKNFKSILYNNKEWIELFKNLNLIYSDDLLNIKFNKNNSKNKLKKFNSVEDNNIPIEYKFKNFDCYKNIIDIGVEREYIIGIDFTNTKIKYLDNNRYIYFLNNTFIICDTNTNNQKYFLEHNSQIIDFDIKNNFIASAEKSSNKIIIWNWTNFEIKSIIYDNCIDNIKKINFDAYLNKLIILYKDIGLKLIIINLPNLLKIKKIQYHYFEIISNSYNFDEYNFNINSLIFNNTDNCFYYPENKRIYKVIIKSEKIKNKNIFWESNNIINCINKFENKILSGLDNGNILITDWNNEYNKEIKAHSSSVIKILISKNNNYFVTVGDDDYIIYWDNSYKILNKININKQVLYLDLNLNDDSILITKSGQIIEIKDNNINNLLEYNIIDKTTGIDINIKNNEFVTCNKNGLLIFWSLENHKKIKEKLFNFELTSIKYSDDLLILSLGCKNGKILIIETKKLNILKILYEQNETIKIMKFCPSFKYFISGNKNGEIYVYDIIKGFKFIRKLKIFENSIKNICFNKNNNLLSISCSRNFIKYYDFELKEVNINNLEFNEWYNWSHVNGWGIDKLSILGVKYINLYNYNQNKYIITYNEDGYLIIYNFPWLDLNFNYYYKFKICDSKIKHLKLINNKLLIISEKNIIYKLNIIAYFKNLNPSIKNDEILEVKTLNYIKNNKNSSIYDLKNYNDEIINCELLDNKESNLIFNLVGCIGYSSFNSINNCKYNKNNDILTFTGNKILKIRKNQEILQIHKKIISCIACSDNKEIFATGEKISYSNEKPSLKIYIWNSLNLKIKNYLDILGEFEINIIKFLYNDTKLIVACSNDQYSKVYIYDLISKKEIMSYIVDFNFIIDINIINNFEFSLITQNTVYFFELNGSDYKVSKIKIDNIDNNKIELTCISNIKNKNYIGCNNGDILDLTHNKIKFKFKEHKTKINIIIFKDEFLYSGDEEGVIIQWKINLNILQVVRQFYHLKNEISSSSIISWDFDSNNNFIIGLKEGEILEINNFIQIKKEIIQTHFNNNVDLSNKIWDISTSKTEYKFITCGDDNFLRLWDLNNLKLLNCVNLKNKLTSCDWSINNEFIITTSKNGLVFLLNSDLEKLDEITSRFNKKDEINIVCSKFNYESNLVAFGNFCNNIEIDIFEIKNKKLNHFKSLNLYNINENSITCIDWGIKNNIIRFDTKNLNNYYYNVSKNKLIEKNNTEFITNNCLFYEEFIKKYKINNFIKYIDVSIKNKYIALVDITNKIIILDIKKNKKIIKNGSLRINKVKFCPNDKYLLVLGNEENLIMKYSIDELKKIKLVKKNQLNKNQINKMEHIDTTKFNTNFNNNYPILRLNNNLMLYTNDNLWKNYNSYFYKNYKPNIKLNLNYIYGYNSEKKQNIIKFLNSEEIIYCKSKYIIILNINKNSQRIFKNHNNKVSCFDINKDNLRVASAEIQEYPIIYIWNAYNLIIYLKIENIVENPLNCISLLKFHNNKIFASFLNKSQTFIIYNIKNNIKLFKKDFMKEIINFIWIDSKKFIIMTMNDLCIFKFINDVYELELKICKKNDYSKYLCLDLNNSDIITGTINGNLEIYQDYQFKKSFILHSNELEIIKITNNCIFTGGSDGIVNILSKNYEEILKINLKKQNKINNKNYSIQYLDYSEDNYYLLVGTSDCEITLIKFKNNNFSYNSQYQFIKLINFHDFNVNNKINDFSLYEKNKFVTISSIGFIKIWNINSNTLTNSYDFKLESKINEINKFKDYELTYLDIFNNLAAIGSFSGILRIFNLENFKHLHIIENKNIPISFIKYSRCGDYLSVGFENGLLDIYKTIDYKRRFSFKVSEDNIKGIDWCTNSNYLRCICKNYLLTFIDIKEGKVINNINLVKNLDWNSFNCIRLWETQGCLTNLDNINSVTKNSLKVYNEYNIWAYNENNIIKISKFPSLSNKSLKLEYYGHINPIKKLKFTFDSDKLISLDKNNIMIWDIKLYK